MRVTTLSRISGLILLLAVYAGCNSTGYTIVEIEEPVEIKTELKQPVSDLKVDTKPTETKFTDKQMVSRTYSIQLGAFTMEDNARKFTNGAKNSISSHDIYYKDIDGLYKVRLGSFSSITDAAAILENLKQAGFGDSFVVELTYFKSENK